VVAARVELAGIAERLVEVVADELVELAAPVLVSCSSQSA
jgi:hypothetical protein